jgi:hypothetical protein
MPILIKGSGGAEDRVYRHEVYIENEVVFERDGGTITLTLPLKLSGACNVNALAIGRMWIGESQSGTANRYRWRFSGAIYKNSGEWCMVNNSTGEGYHSDDLDVDFTYDGSNLVLTITDERTLGVMDEDATYFNQFTADLYYTEG